MAKATEIFSDGFESGNFSAWTSTTGTPTTQGTTVHHGLYAMKVDATTTYATKTFASAKTLIYARLYIRFSGLPTSGGYIRVFGNTVPDWSPVTIEVCNDAGTIKWRVRIVSTYLAATGPSVDTWYCIEFKADASDDTWEFFVDGSSVLNGTDFQSTNSTGIQVGIFGFSGSVTWNTFFDCVVVADAYIGTEDVPLHSDVNVNSTLAGQPSEFVVKWTSPNLNLSHGIYGTNNTGTWNNDTAVALTGTVDWLNTTKTLNTTANLRVEWRVWANDTDNQWGDTGICDLTTQGTAPQSSYEATNSTYTGKSVQLSVKWTGINLEGGIFGWNNTGTPTNDTWTDFWDGTPDVAWMYVNKTLNSTVGLTIEWQAWANNTGSEWGATGSQYLVTTKTNVSVTIISPTNTTYSGGFTVEIDADFVPSAESYNYSVTADSGYHADIQSAIDDVEANGGGAVYIPEGTFNFVNVEESWTGARVTIPAGIDLFGAPTQRYANGSVIQWKTVLVMPWDSPTAIWFKILGTGDANKPSRFSDIKLVGYRSIDSNSTTMPISINIAYVVDFRVDHNYFDNIAGGAKVFGSNGVFDHNFFVNTNGIPTPYVTATVGYGIQVDRAYADVWEDDVSKVLGKYTNYTVFIEHNYFEKWRHVTASNNGAHYVLRYNIIKDDFGYGSVDAHGLGTPAGARATEIYNNTIIDAIQYVDAIRMRGGAGVAFNNTAGGGTYTRFMSLSNDATNSKYWINDWWIWSNTLTGMTEISEWSEDITEGINYFRYAPHTFNYESYPYPHPLTIIGGASGVEAVWYNIKYSNGSWVYAQNQTYTESIELELLAGLYNFYVWGNNTFGDVDSDTVWFTIHGYFSTQALANYNTNLESSGLPYITETTEVIIALSYSSNRLTFTVNASSEVTSTTQVYCANKSMPNRVDGALGWSYVGGIVTVNVLHASSQQVVLDWTPGSTTLQLRYVLTVTVVDEDGTGLPNVTISIVRGFVTVNIGQADIHGQCMFSLEQGTYDVIAGTPPSTNQTMVSLDQDKSLSLVLRERGIVESAWLGIPPQIRQVLVYLAIIFVGLIITVLATGYLGKGNKKRSIRKLWEKTW